MSGVDSDLLPLGDLSSQMGVIVNGLMVDAVWPYVLGAAALVTLGGMLASVYRKCE